MLSNHEKEVQKWNTVKSKGGMRPDTFCEFPRMMYKARKKNGPPLVIDPYDEPWSMGNCQIVKDETERNRLWRQGWRDNPAEAIAQFLEDERNVADEAAHRHYLDRNMSEKAKAEAAAVDSESFGHVPEVPEGRKKPGPKPKE